MAELYLLNTSLAFVSVSRLVAALVLCTTNRAPWHLKDWQIYYGINLHGLGHFSRRRFLGGRYISTGVKVAERDVKVGSKIAMKWKKSSLLLFTCFKYLQYALCPKNAGQKCAQSQWESKQQQIQISITYKITGSDKKIIINYALVVVLGGNYWWHVVPFLFPF